MYCRGKDRTASVLFLVLTGRGYLFDRGSLLLSCAWNQSTQSFVITNENITNKNIHDSKEGLPG
jgi:hypothetical protein